MMQQYEAAKRTCPGALLLFRMGDFYELFHEDARTAARLLQLTLTSRDKGQDPTPMAGFPHHQLDSYLAKLVAAGIRVAVCDQVEDAKQAKGLVRREVTRIVTPGTLVDDALLDPLENNFLAAVAPGPTCAMAWVELSTGRFEATHFPEARLSDELARIAPVECLLADEAELPPEVASNGMLITRRAGWAFSRQTGREALHKHFGTATLAGFGFEDDAPEIPAAGAILDYLTETQKSSLAHIQRLAPYRREAALEIDEATRRSLEITCTLRAGRREGSLLAVMDRTQTAMGARLLADWVGAPLADRPSIENRHAAVAELVAEDALTAALREKLREVYDVQRLLSRVATGRASPRDLSFLARTLAALPALKAKLTARSSRRLQELEASLDLCPEIRGRLEAALADDCPLLSRDGGFIRAGYNDRLDELRQLASGGKQWIAEYQAAEAERTGISSLKVGFNKVFGYYLEVTHAHRDKVPDDYIRKQTVKNAERYVTPALKEHEEKLLSADEQSKQLEYELFLQLRDAVAEQLSRLEQTARTLSEIDVLAALADLARARGYCRPTMTEDAVLAIAYGRHPVLDALAPEGTFVPNDVVADDEHGRMLVITGPNMAGKSTYIRQVALITLMAQVGSFVPARSATIGIADRIFARVGASDELSRGRSTFMVEMTETARILNTATGRSLVILDEIGRGTSTYDGLSLAWAVVEFLHERVGCRTLFATHYHELTDLASTMPQVSNLNVAVREWQDELVFLHKIVTGPADKSYGIHVARLAGVPPEVIERAKEILAQLEAEHLDEEGRPKIARPETGKPGRELQLTLFGVAEHPLLDEIRQVDLERTTPLEAFQLLSRWRAALAVERPSKAK